MSDLTALYRIAVKYDPPDAPTQWFVPTWGYINLTTNMNREWSEAWNQATHAEKVAYCQWHANVICRTWVALCTELLEQEHIIEFVEAADVVNPAQAVGPEGDGPGYIEFKVPDERADQWVARTRALVAEVIAGDPEAPPTDPETHPGIKLTTPTVNEEQPR